MCLSKTLFKKFVCLFVVVVVFFGCFFFCYMEDGADEEDEDCACPDGAQE